MQNAYAMGMKWNDRLVISRDRAGVTDTDIARTLKVSNPTVHGWMTGNTKNIEARFLLPLCKFLNVSPFWVIFGEDSDFEFGQLSATEQIKAIDAIRLISAFAHTDDEGRARILGVAEETRKLFPRG
jgi:transcriptional regulator with XRE-family HTH domain